MKNSISALTLGASILALGGTACEARNCDHTDRVEVEEGADRSEEGACTEFVFIDTFWEGGDYSPDEPLDYQEDGNISVRGGNGTITIEEGTSDQIGVLMEYGVGRPGDTCDGEPETDSGYCEEIDNNLSHFEPIVEEDSDGNWLIQALLDGGPSTLRADITVTLPSNFNGLLEVDQGNGDVQVDGVQDAWSVDVKNRGAGGIDIDDAGPAEEVRVQNETGDCNLDVGSASFIDIFCDVSDLTVNVRGVPDGTDKRRMENGLGDLVVNFPNTDQGFNVQARSGGSPITVTGDCEENRASDASLTVSCNDGVDGDPLYEVVSESSLVDITLNL